MSGVVATFDPLQFQTLIDGLGLDFHWRRAIPCPCAVNTNQSYNPDPNCEFCGSDGWRYINPQAREAQHSSNDFSPIRAVFSSVALDPKLNQEFGPWGMGDALLTVPGGADVGFRDQFIGIQQRMPFAETFVSGTSDTVKVGKTRRTSSAQLNAIRYEPVAVNIIVDAADNRFYQGIHFDVREATQTEPARIVWRTGQRPASGTRLAIHYIARPVWVVDQATYAAQHARGPLGVSRGTLGVQTLPTTFKVALDWLTEARGS